MSYIKHEKTFLKSLPNKPGVYQMSDRNGEIIYVGKAKNLKKRVSSYFRKIGIDAKSLALMEQVAKIEVTITANENEALLLENNLIKQFRPQYNIYFKDDKSFPYLYLSEHKFPRLSVYRGAKDLPGNYFGPYPSAGAVRETLHIAQRIFLLRSCNETFFRHRTRPCLQYQIKRCSAPCVGYIEEEDYQHSAQMLAKFLRGKNKTVIEEFRKKMLAASAGKNFELAAYYRDKLTSLSNIQMPQRVIKDRGDLDVIALAEENRVVCLQVLLVRSGAVVGSKAYFPKIPIHAAHEEIISSFLQRNYLDFISREELPQKILINIPFAESKWLEAALEDKYEHKMHIIDKTSNSVYKSWLRLAETNAYEAIARHIVLEIDLGARFSALQKDLRSKSLQRIECFDISHAGGEATIGVCVVFTINGTQKNDYRRFNILDITPGDDYAALRQALTRHYQYLKEHGGKFPDILLIDGGKGQLHIAREVLKALQINDIILLAIAKDKTRKHGVDIIYRSEGDEPLLINCSPLGLHLLQQVRDETHRYAITSHRKRYAKSRRISSLESIPGIGAKRRIALLKHFGGLQEIKNASAEEMAKVKGINLDLAKKIYQHFHL